MTPVRGTYRPWNDSQVRKNWVGVGAGESIAFELRSSMLGLLGIALRLVALCIVAGYCLGHANTWITFSSWLATAFQIAIAVGLVLLIRPMAWRPFRRWAHFKVIVTTNRVLVRFDRKNSIGWDMPLLAISDIAVKRGPFQRLLGVGTLTLLSPMANGPAALPNVDRVGDVEIAIVELRTAAWQAYQRSQGSQVSL